MIDKAMALSFRYLSFKARTESEIRTYLEKNGYSEDIINEVVDKLKEYNYINDDEYTLSYHRYQTKTKGYGPLRISYNLKQKGISKEKYSEVEAQQETDYYAIALTLAKKKLKGKNDFESLKKVYAFLLRRGFTMDVVTKVINTIKDDITEES